MLRRNLLQENLVLSAVDAADSEQLRAALEPVTLHAGEALYEPGRLLREVYFPVSAVVTLLNTTEDGAPSAIAMVGNDGMLGVGLLMGVDVARSRAVVARAGDAFRISWPRLEILCSRSDNLRQLFLRCAHALTMQVAQTAVCNRRHLVKQRLASWLLWMLDHSVSREVYATHESIAVMLGVRREAISDALKRLQEAGLLACGRGRVTVLDRFGLRAQACGCYETIRAENHALFHAAAHPHDGAIRNAGPPSQNLSNSGFL